jgi:hypothetical protein
MPKLAAGSSAFAVAVAAADDLLLPLMPPIVLDELIEHLLDVADQLLGRFVARLCGHPIRVPAADDVADAVLMAVDGELVGDGQRPALGADLAELLFGGEGDAGGRSPAGLGADLGPAGAVGVTKGLGRVDEVVPEVVEGLKQPFFQPGQPGVGLGR